MVDHQGLARVWILPLPVSMKTSVLFCLYFLKSDGRNTYRE